MNRAKKLPASGSSNDHLIALLAERKTWQALFAYDADLWDRAYLAMKLNITEAEFLELRALAVRSAAKEFR